MYLLYLNLAEGDLERSGSIDLLQACVDKRTYIFDLYAMRQDAAKGDKTEYDSATSSMYGFLQDPAITRVSKAHFFSDLFIFASSTITVEND